jgi:ribosomal 50S subunit-recycling heat shock protein
MITLYNDSKKLEIKSVTIYSANKSRTFKVGDKIQVEVESTKVDVIVTKITLDHVSGDQYAVNLFNNKEFIESWHVSSNLLKVCFYTEVSRRLREKSVLQSLLKK